MLGPSDYLAGRNNCVGTRSSSIIHPLGTTVRGTSSGVDTSWRTSLCKFVLLVADVQLWWKMSSFDRLEVSVKNNVDTCPGTN